MTTTQANPTRTHANSSADAFAEWVMGSILGTLDTWALFVGESLGLYQAMAAEGPLTSSRLTELTEIHPRYGHEWLEHQVVAGVISVDDPTAPPQQRIYSLPEGHVEVLTDADSLAFMAPFVRLVVAGGAQMPALIEAYQSGEGVSWSEFGDDMRTGTADANRPWFLNELAASWFPSVPQLQDKLLAGASVADVGCGEGWSSIAMATGYPESTIDGYDIDQASIEAARHHAGTAGVANRTQFTAVDVAAADPGKKYDVVTAFECIHDMPDPVGALRAMRNMVDDEGFVLVMDEAVGDTFGERFDEIERLMYGLSMFICLPDGMSHQPSAGTGTVMRPDTLEKYAREAGFAGVEVLPIEHDMWRFYRLRPEGAQNL